MNAKKATMGPKEAADLLKDADELYVTKGKKVLHFNLKKNPPNIEELQALMLGPTGNLRAPTVRKGKTLIVGFDAATYGLVFK